MTNSRNRIQRKRQGGVSLVEVLLVIAIIAVLTGVAIPVIQGLDRVNVAKSKRNAQMTVELSGNLTSLNIAHILPESLGGAEATARLLQSGIVINEGELKGTRMGMQSMAKDDVEATATYIELVHDDSGMRLKYNPNH